MKTVTRSGRAEMIHTRGGGLVAGLLALVLIGGAAPPAFAGQDPGIRLGYFTGGDADNPVPALGVFARFDIPGPLNLEVSADYRRELIRSGDLEATVIPVRASAVLSFLPVVSPYLLAGGGIEYVGIAFNNDFEGTSSDSTVVVEAHAGGGVEVSFGPLSLIGDLRYSRSGAVSADSVRRALGHDYDPSGWYASLSAGISF